VQCPLLALSGHPLVPCTCLLLTQSGHRPCCGRPYLSDQKPGLHGLASGVFKERHEPEIHVQLLMTMKQCVARIVSHKIDLYFLVTTEHYDVLDDAGRRSFRHAREFETMSVEMELVDVVAGIAKF